jgi:hypothetical protein
MATIITRELGATPKGSPLTNAEIDTNFINLNEAVEAASGALSGSVVLDAYTANGIQIAFALSTTPESIEYTTVTINGITQARTLAYTVNDDILTFTERPPFDANIEVITLITQAGSSPSTIRTVTSSGNILTTDSIILALGAITLTLPSATSGNKFQIKNIGDGEVTLNCSSAQTIDNKNSIVIRYRNSAISLISDGNNWRIF